MTRRRLFCLVSIVLVFLGLTLIAKTSLDHLPAPSWGNLVDDGSFISLEKMQVGQTFVAPLPGLWRIEVALKPGRDGSEVPLTFVLRSDPAAKEDIWRATANRPDLQPGAFYAFEFPPQRSSRGQGYYFSVEPLDPAPAENAMTIGYNANAILDGASAYVDGEPVSGNLQFRTSYALRARDWILLFLDRMAEGRPYFLGTPGFYVVLALVYGLVLGLFLLRAARIFLGEGEQNP